MALYTSIRLDLWQKGFIKLLVNKTFCSVVYIILIIALSISQVVRLDAIMLFKMVVYKKRSLWVNPLAFKYLKLLLSYVHFTRLFWDFDKPQ